MPDARLVSTTEAAEAFGLSAETLTRWARQGRVTPAVATQGPQRTTYRWDLDDLRRQIGGQSSNDE